MKKILEILMYPYNRYLEHRKWKKRLQELKARDPFIYK
jgi:hypothetical protein